MQYYSTNRQSPWVDFREAAIAGQAPDKGLYFPSALPTVNPSLIQHIKEYSNEAIGYEVMRPYVGEAIDATVLKQIVEETVNFPIPLVKINDSISALELFHGPTLAFKDVGARFMSRCLGYFLKNETKKVTVLVATSGDTGGAVANGFLGVEGVEVVILYPSGKVSPVQEKQLTALGNNIKALEIDGSFDDCQRMVKQAFADTSLTKQLFLTSANSINVARWLPQQLYYFFAHKQWEDQQHPPVIAVPSGNFGNICAGMLAAKTGLPVQHFIAACNDNHIVTDYLSTGEWTARKAVPTLSNAMDVADPSNFVRILEIFLQSFPDLKKQLSSYAINDTDTMSTISRVYADHHYTLDPHGAVGYLALEKYVKEHPSQKGIFLETAHPVKFPEPVSEAIGHAIEMPAAVEQLMKAEKKSLQMEASYEDLRSFLLGA